MDSTTGTSQDSAGDKRYEYFAFISYKHEDMRWAKWLQQQIETYRLPSIIRKQAPHLPKHIRPVFRDQTDISTGPLLQNLRQELQDSRFLIVLCSPAAAKSEWVNREVQHFIDMGRADRIIPFVVAGTPNASNPDEECFPAILRGAEQAMLGVSVPELGKEKAFVKVVAKLLGLKFDQLWDRHRRRQRRQRLFRGLMAAALLVAAAIGGLAYLGLPPQEGRLLCRLRRMPGRSPGHRRTERRTGPAPPSLVEIRVFPLPRRPRSRASTAAARPTDTEDVDRPADRSFHYRDNGALEYAIEFTATGKELRKSRLFPGLVDRRVQGRQQGAAADAGQVPAGRHGGAARQSRVVRSGPTHSEIAAWELKYDDLGRVVRRTYLNQSGYPTSDANGIYVQEFTYTPAGKVKAIRYLDIGGQPCPTKRGIAGSSTNTMPKEIAVQTTWIGRTGTPALNEDGYAIEKQKYDADGNLVEVAYFGADGKPCLHKDGFAGWKAATTSGETRRACPTSAPTASPACTRTGYAGWKAQFDDRGNRTSWSFFGTDGKPCLIKDGYAGGRTPTTSGETRPAVLLRHRRQALLEQGRNCRMEGQLRRPGKPDERVLLRHRRQALPEQGRVCRHGRPSSTSGETRRARPTSASTASPA